MLVNLKAARIEWADGTYVLIGPTDDLEDVKFQPLHIAGSPSFCGIEQSALPTELTYSGVPATGFQRLSIFENREYALEIRLPLRREEAIRKRASSRNLAWPFLNDRLSPFIQVVSTRSWIDDGGVFTRIAAFFNPREYLGAVDLTVWREDRKLFVEVESRKIDYQAEYQLLLDGVAEFHLSLIQEVGSLAGAKLRTTSSTSVTTLSSYFHMRRLMRSEMLPEAIAHVLQSPISTLIIEEQAVPLHRAKRVSAADVFRRQATMDFRSGGALAHRFHGKTPTTLPVRLKRQTFDTAENRYVKAFLEDIHSLLCDLEAAAKVDRRINIGDEIRRWRENVEEWSTHPMWHVVKATREGSANSQKLQRRIGYRAILQADAEMRDALALPLEGLDDDHDILGDAKPVHTLYEYWCFFMIRRIMITLYGNDRSRAAGLAKESKGGLTLTLKSGEDGAGAHWELQKGERTVEIFLYFQKSFSAAFGIEWGIWSGSYSLQFDPDISIAVRIDGVTHWLVFDAKYRFDDPARSIGTNGGRTRGNTASREFKKEDLNKMHTYRDAILGTRGAYVIYPGSAQISANQYFVRQPPSNRTENNFPSVGAFSLRPTNSDSEMARLQAFISRAIADLATRGQYAEETGFT